ncbi:hypothetical protein O9992_21970 [Vibrio lentus]|nr:hypothetical protein [Vibrio lentus]
MDFNGAYLTANVEGQSVRFDQAEYYEFTNDKGLNLASCCFKTSIYWPRSVRQSQCRCSIERNAKQGIKTQSATPFLGYRC